MATPPSRTEVAASVRHSHALGGAFLVADLELALTLLERAESASGRDAFERNVGHAREALRTVDGFVEKLKLADDQLGRISALREQLAQRLHTLGA
jgi:hypothetical protein